MEEILKNFWIDGPGLKYKISNIQAAFASGQLERVKHLILMKRRIFDWHKEFLQNNSNLRLLEEKKVVIQIIGWLVFF